MSKFSLNTERSLRIHSKTANKLSIHSHLSASVIDFAIGRPTLAAFNNFMPFKD
ncbi:hypothetical protein QWZ13_10590 [Reinekea marina]|uniref:hypothetical protein n=1 Tax=Reinekea marina TaxID=1310421 RepID=UPI0025B48099|nr:hypothetical protein [Reinekea marina]MDN3649358.1 hypothetical protein [Reinekea marina]